MVVLTRVAFVAYSGTKVKESGLVSQSSRVRVLNVARKLQALGVHCDVSFLSSSSLERTLLSIKESDLAIFHRIQAGKFFVPLRWSCLYLLAKLERPVLFDFDDSIQINFPALTNLCAKLANAVTVGSHELYQFSKRLNDETFLIPSGVDTDIFKPLTNQTSSVFAKRNNMIVIGWHGSATTHFQNLAILREVLKKLRQQVDVEVVLRLVGGPFTSTLAKQFDGISAVETGPDKWIEYSVLPNYLAGIDVGVYPLRNTRVTRAKASMKLIEQMAMGIPVVASAIGENNYVIDDGEDGFLAHNAGEWVSYLTTLIEAPALRQKVGANAREKVLHEYSLDVVVPKLKDVFESVLD